MDLIFTKAGKYKNGTKVLLVEERDVEAERIFPVQADNGVEFIKAGSAKAYSPDDPTADDFDGDGEVDLKSLKVDELKALAEEKGIDLGDAKKKDEIIAVIETAGTPDDPTADDSEESEN